MNHKKWTGRPGNLWQWIRNFTQEVMLHGCMFLGKMVEEDLESSLKSEENGLGWYVKNNIEWLLVAVRTNRSITHQETVDPK